MPSSDSGMKIAIIGGGISGLSAAYFAQKNNIPFELHEASGTLGGRIQTDLVDGFRLDRGFQVFSTGYKSFLQELDLDIEKAQKELNFKKFNRGALLYKNDKPQFISSKKLQRTLYESGFSISQLLALGKFTLLLDRLTIPKEDMLLKDFLEHHNLKGKIFDEFLTPFLRGVFLDRNLNVSAIQFKRVWSNFRTSDSVIPALGMGEIPKYIASQLNQSQIFLDSSVLSVQIENKGGATITFENGTTNLYRGIILAVDALSAAKILPTEALEQPLSQKFGGCQTAYFEVSSRFDKPILHLNAASPIESSNRELKGGIVNEVAPMSAVSAALAPAGRHLISVTTLEFPSLSPDQIVEKIKSECEAWYGPTDVAKWRFIKMYSIQNALPSQPPGFKNNVPKISAGFGKIRLAGDYLGDASIEGAGLSGVDAVKSLFGIVDTK